ncbi:hypothetical protein [Lactovum odontotermitis]
MTQAERISQNDFLALMEKFGYSNEKVGRFTLETRSELSNWVISFLDSHNRAPSNQEFLAALISGRLKGLTH